MNIKCPHCGKILLIKQQITDFSRVITCPVCKESSALSNFRILDNNRQPQGDHTQYGGQGGRSDFNDCTHFNETQATGHTNYGNSLIGSLTITGAPQASPCKLIIGKMSYTEKLLSIYQQEAANKNMPSVWIIFHYRRFYHSSLPSINAS